MLTTKTDTTSHDTGFSEVGIVTYEGTDFAAGGAYVSDDYLICYPDGETVASSVKNWGPNVLGHIVKVSSRPAIFFGHRSYMASRYFYFRVRLTDGRLYAVRGFGKGMIARGKRIKA